jgi:hypothetical protein
MSLHGSHPHGSHPRQQSSVVAMKPGMSASSWMLQAQLRPQGRSWYPMRTVTNQLSCVPMPEELAQLRPQGRSWYPMR